MLIVILILICNVQYCAVLTGEDYNLRRMILIFTFFIIISILIIFDMLDMLITIGADSSNEE